MFTMKLYRQTVLHIRHYDTVNIITNEDEINGAHLKEQCSEPAYTLIRARLGESVKDWLLYAGDKAYIVNSSGKTIESVTGRLE